MGAEWADCWFSFQTQSTVQPACGPAASSSKMKRWAPASSSPSPVDAELRDGGGAAAWRWNIRMQLWTGPKSLWTQIKRGTLITGMLMRWRCYSSTPLQKGVAFTIILAKQLLFVMTAFDLELPLREPGMTDLVSRSQANTWPHPPSVFSDCCLGRTAQLPILEKAALHSAPNSCGSRIGSWGRVPADF